MANEKIIDSENRQSFTRMGRQIVCPLTAVFRQLSVPTFDIAFVGFMSHQCCILPLDEGVPRLGLHFDVMVGLLEF